MFDRHIGYHLPREYHPIGYYFLDMENIDGIKHVVVNIVVINQPVECTCQQMLIVIRSVNYGCAMGGER